jgi:hypothetical protein
MGMARLILLVVVIIFACTNGVEGDRMLKRMLAGLTLLIAAAGPARADLHYTMRMDIHKISSTETENPMPGMAGEMMAQVLLPDGPIESVYWISEKGMRVELTKGIAMVPAGFIVLRLADGTIVMTNPLDRTYWKIPIPDLMPQALNALAQLKPEVSTVHTGEFATIAGLHAEHVTSTTTMDSPVPPGGANTPMSMPSAMTTSIDYWVADQYADYAQLTHAMPAMFGLSELVPPGFIVKSLTRSSMFPGYELESTVIDLKEEPAPAGLFELPADYKEVEPLRRAGKPIAQP